VQLLGDGYEIPEMTKLHCLLPPSRFAQRSASNVDRRIDDSWPPLLRVWDTGGAWPTRASVSSKSTHKSPLRQTHIGGIQAGPRGLAHRCCLLASAHMRLVG
jgi:hypothetical protein